MDKDNRTERRKTGDRGEEAVIRILCDQGYRLVVRNFEVHGVGELDCVFEKEREIYVVEVRSRWNTGPSPTSGETVTYSKRRKIRRTTSYLIAKYGWYDRNINFLIGQVTHNRAGMVQNVEFIPF